MRFEFTDEQRLLQQTVREFLAGEAPVEWVRARWETETGRSRDFWRRLAEVGVPGLLVAEEHGGLGLDETDLVLLLEETGRAALAEPVVAAAVAAPLLTALPDPAPAASWLPRLAAGDAVVAVGHPVNAFVADAHVADLLLLAHGDEVHAVAPGAVTLTPQPCNDPGRRLFSVAWTPGDETRVAAEEAGRALLHAALDRGALACAAQALGVGQALVDLAVRYACQRRQFGVPIGSFQAIKHMLADVQVKLEYARSLVYRSAWSVARAARCRAVEVSMGKVAACEAAGVAARVALQVHGAIGYTWEQDVHVWMRRAWSLEHAWGDGAFHRGRVADGVVDETLPAEALGYGTPV